MHVENDYTDQAVDCAWMTAHPEVVFAKRLVWDQL